MEAQQKRKRFPAKSSMSGSVRLNGEKAAQFGQPGGSVNGRLDGEGLRKNS
jgi:hypothetical protein